jgi:hypothetical protein
MWQHVADKISSSTIDAKNLPPAEGRRPMSCGSPFESIESAYEFVALLAETVLEAQREIETTVQREKTSPASRRSDALRIASYNLGKLELHMNHSRRILNDLRSLRRLLFQERAKPAAVQAQTAPKPEPVALAVGAKLKRLPLTPTPATVRSPARPGAVAA